ncbi:MAG: dihydrofolate reductase family protein, partial [Nitrososphaerales archaeon]
LLSHRVRSTTWQNSRIMKGDLSQIISSLKKEKGKNIIIEGGPALVKEAIKRGLLDEYRILVQPVILGKGPNYWGTMPVQRNMKLKSVKTLRYGELVLNFEAFK